MAPDVVAFVVSGSHGAVDAPLSQAFIDHPHLAQILSHTTRCQVLAKADLHQPLASTDLSQLTSAEHTQIKYWKLATTGELLFNYWD